MQDRLLTYDEVLEATKENERFLLLGNGFSMSYNYERFSFTSLQESAVERGYIKKDSPIYRIFENFETKDFEEVVKMLETSIRVLTEYDVIKEKDKIRIQEDAIALKAHLVETITNNHPEKITDIQDEEFENSSNFIKEYNRIYTLNYDLLLYWTTIKLQTFITEKIIDDKTVKLKIGDGFYDPDRETTDYVTYANNGSAGRNQRIFYLHGALHIFDKKYKIIKHTYSRTKKTLTEQTLDNLNKNIYPIFVSEGTSKQKKSKILHSAYLNYCYKSLKSIGGKNSLIIFGTMLKANDEHIQDAIIDNNIKKIYIGIGSKDNIFEFAPFVEEANKRYKKVYFYDYRSAKVWR